MNGRVESLVGLPCEQQRGMDPVKVVEVGAAGQDQAAIVIGHQAGCDGHLCPSGGRTISGEVKFIQP